MTKLSLPWPPTVNSYLKPFKSRLIKTKKHREYHANCYAIVSKFLPFDGELHVELLLSPPDKRRRDIDNYNKAVLDVMKGHLYHDDSQIKRLDIFMCDKVEGGMVWVSVTPHCEGRRGPGRLFKV